MAAVFVRFKDNKPSKEQLIELWDSYISPIARHNLPSAPKKFLNYFHEDNRPQTKLDRDLEGGMAVSIGRLRADSQYDYKFVSLSHNTLRGAAGGGVLLAELLCAENYI
jgi:aspartate-semialdehyde dehydrogenase